jgi:hypothetical protein
VTGNYGGISLLSTTHKTLPNIIFSGQLHRPNREHLVDLDVKDQQPIIYSALDTHWLKTAVLMTSRKPVILL